MRFLLQFSLYVAAGSLGLVLASNSAQALTVQATVNGITYDVTTFTGSYNANSSKFDILANNGLMPWWGNGGLARQFANAVSASFGLINGNLGTFFATSFTTFTSTFAQVDSRAFNYESGQKITAGSGPSDAATYATATVATPSASVPSPLPIFGAAAAFSMSRRLRRRIQLGG